MFDFLSLLFSSIFAPVRVGDSQPQAGGYYEGDDSPWITADEGPVYGANR